MRNVKRQRLLPEVIRSVPVFGDFADDVDDLLTEYIDDPALLLSKLRAIDTTDDRYALIHTASMLGFSKKLFYLDQERILRLITHLSKFRNENSTESFIKFLGFMLNRPLPLHYLWTDDYRAFFINPQGPRLLSDFSIRLDETLDEPGWYNTTHCLLRVNPRSYFPDSEDPYKDMEELFYSICPAYLVLDLIGNMRGPFKERLSFNVGVIEGHDVDSDQFSYEVLSNETPDWKRGADLFARMQFHGQSQIKDGRALITGGFAGNDENEKFSFILDASLTRWDKKDPDITEDVTISALGYSPSLTMLILGTRGGGLSLSKDGGNTWENVWSPFYEDEEPIVSVLWVPQSEQFVAFTHSGKYTHTTDGRTWTNPVKEVGFEINAAATGNGVVLVVGENGGGATSIDLNKWDTFSLSTHPMYTTVYDPDRGQFFIGGNCGDAFIGAGSSVAESWEAVDVGFGSHNIVTSDYSKDFGLYIIGGDNARLAVSADGRTWFLRDAYFRTYDIDFVAYLPGVRQFMAVGIKRENETISDESVEINQDGLAVVYDPDEVEGRRLTEPGTITAMSPDGYNWELYPSQFDGSLRAKATIRNGEAIIVGGTHKDLRVSYLLERYFAAKELPQPRAHHIQITVDENTVIVAGGESYGDTKATTWKYNVPTNNWTSIPNLPIPLKDAASSYIPTMATGEIWTARSTQFGVKTIRDVAHVPSNDLYIAVGDEGYVSTSLFGLSWTKQTNVFPANKILGGFLQTEDRINHVSVDTNRAIYKFNTTLDGGETWTSSDITWPAGSHPLSYFHISGLPPLTFRSCYSGTTADGVITESSDGKVWGNTTIFPDPQTTVLDGYYAEDIDRFFVVGDSPFIAISADKGQSWEYKDLGGGNIFIAVSYLDGHGYALSYEGVFVYTEDLWDTILTRGSIELGTVPPAGTHVYGAIIPHYNSVLGDTLVYVLRVDGQVYVFSRNSSYDAALSLAGNGNAEFYVTTLTEDINGGVSGRLLYASHGPNTDDGDAVQYFDYSTDSWNIFDVVSALTTNNVVIIDPLEGKLFPGNLKLGVAAVAGGLNKYLFGGYELVYVDRNFNPLTINWVVPQIPNYNNKLFKSELREGELKPQTVHYKITVLDESGETAGSNNLTIKVPLTERGAAYVLNWPLLKGAKGYRIYGRKDGDMGLLYEAGADVDSWVDDGNVVPDKSIKVPTVNTTGLGVGRVSVADPKPYITRMMYDDANGILYLAASNGKSAWTTDLVNFIGSTGLPDGQEVASFINRKTTSYHIMSGTNGTVGISQNGIDWNFPLTGTTNSITCITHDPVTDTIFCGTDTDQIVYSKSIAYDPAFPAQPPVQLGNVWNTYNTGFGSVKINDIDAGLYVDDTSFVIAVGDNGKILLNKTAVPTEWEEVIINSELDAGLLCVSNIIVANGSYTYVGGKGGYLAVTPNIDNVKLTSVVGYPYNEDVLSIEYYQENTLYVATGKKGTTAVSSDGISWEAKYIGGIASDIVGSFGNADNIIAHGDLGAFIWSPDGGKLWINVYSGVSNSTVYTAVSNNDTVILAGDRGSAVRSIDGGATWEIIDVNFGIEDVRSGASNSTVFLLGGTSGKLTRSIDNGVTWTVEDIGVTGKSITHLANNGSIYFAVLDRTSMRKSTDGITWTSVTLPKDTPEIKGITSGGTNEFMLSCANGIILHTINNGTSWTKVVIPIAPYLERLNFNKKDESTGDSGTVRNDSISTFTLPPGFFGASTLKTKLPEPPRMDLTAVGYSGSRFFLGSSQGDILISSPTGIKAWELKDSPLDGIPLNVAASGGGVMLLAGERGALSTSTVGFSSKIIVTGGSSSDNIARQGCYYLVGGIWSPSPSMVTKRTGHGQATLSDGTVMVMGGTDETGQALATVDRFLPHRGIWIKDKDLPYAKSWVKAVGLKNYSVLVTGAGPDPFDSAMVFVPALRPPGPPRLNPGPGFLNAGEYAYTVTATTSLGETTPSLERKIVLLTGNQGVLVDWEPVANAVSYNVYGRNAGAVTVLATVNGDTTIFADYGVISGSVSTLPKTIEDAWMEVDNSMPLPREGHGASKFLGDTVLISGGYRDYRTWRFTPNPYNYKAPIDETDIDPKLLELGIEPNLLPPDEELPGDTGYFEGGDYVDTDYVEGD